MSKEVEGKNQYTHVHACVRAHTHSHPHTQ